MTHSDEHYDQEPSSGKVDTALAESLQQLLDSSRPPDDLESAIRQTVSRVLRERRYPALALACYVAANFWDVSRLGPFLKAYVAMKKTLNRKLIDIAAQPLKLHEGDGIFIYGYSEPILAVMEACFRSQSTAYKNEITMFVPETSSRRRRGEALKSAERLAALGLSICIFPDFASGHHLLWGKPKLQRVNKIFLGCKSIVLKERHVKFNCTIGARLITRFARAENLDTEVYIFGETYKIWPVEGDDSSYLDDILTSEAPDSWLTEEEEAQLKALEHTEGTRIEVKSFESDLVPAKLVDYLITEARVLPGEEITPQVLTQTYTSQWPELAAYGFWDAGIRARGREIVRAWMSTDGERKSLSVTSDSEVALDHCSVNIEGLSAPISLREALAITRDWDMTNRRRFELIDKKMEGILTAQEEDELRHLQKLAGAKRQLIMPLPIKELAEIEAALRRTGLWRDE